MAQEFKYLFTPITIRHKVAKNRIPAAAITFCFFLPSQMDSRKIGRVSRNRLCSGERWCSRNKIPTDPIPAPRRSAAYRIPDLLLREWNAVAMIRPVKKNGSNRIR